MVAPQACTTTSTRWAIPPPWLHSEHALRGHRRLPVDLPSGYSTSNMRQLPYVITTDGSANVVYVVWAATSASVLSPQPNSSVSSTNFTACDFSASVPKISTLARVETKLYNNAGGSNYVKLSPTVSGTYYSSVLSQAANGTYFEETSVALNSTRSSYTQV